MKHETFMKMAFALAEESKCCSVKVGALYVIDGRIISTGINGSVAGQKNCCDHALEQGWIEQEIPVTDKVCFEYTNSYGNRKLFRDDVPHGTTHIVQSNFLDRLNCIKLYDSDVYKYENGVWKKQRYSFKTIEHLVVWTNPNFGLRQYSFIGRKTLNQAFREEHHAWANEHEIHAEVNGLLFAAKNGVSVDGSTLYVTHSPCVMCVKTLAQSGVVQVVYSNLYDKNPENWKQKLEDAGINVIQVRI